jgi:L-lactate dehydrogenase (cytochrome)
VPKLETDPCRPVYVDFTFESAVSWLKSLTDLPIVVKGIQSWEDALLCQQWGVHPWLSNHGGRQLDSAPSALETLLDIREHCPGVLAETEVIVDGGITRGSDVVKALALGARAVGVGRGFLYSMIFGQRGVEKAMEILKHEIETTMALLGVMTLDELGPQHVSRRSRSVMCHI